MAESIPVHVLSGPDLMAASMRRLHPDLRPGDAFLHNSPYDGNSHAADMSLLVPVFDDDGRHRFTVLSKAHLADIGNAEPTPYHAMARDVYEEGAVILPCVKVQSGYRDIEDVIRMCQVRIRVPDKWWGDYLALLGAARVGEREVRALAAEVGWDRIDAFVDAWFDYSEGRMADVHRAASRTASGPSHPPRSVRPHRRRHPAQGHGSRRRRARRGRPARQPRLPAVRPQPDGGDRPLGGDARGHERHQRLRPAERRHLPAHPRPPARELRGGHPSAPSELLGLDLQRARPHRQRRAARDRRARRRLRHGRGRHEHPGVGGGALGPRPAQRRRAVHRPARARLDRRPGRPRRPTAG